MLVIERVQSEAGATYQVGLDEQGLTDYVAGLAKHVNRYPANARFIFNDETHQLEVIQPAVIGRTLDVTASVQQIKQQVLDGQHTVSLSLTVTQPQVGDDAWRAAGHHRAGQLPHQLLPRLYPGTPAEHRDGGEFHG
jgi:vancomycin resistance protein YoaR